MDEKIATLMAVTNCEFETALTYLSAANEDVSLAMTLMEAEKGEGGHAAPSATPSPPVAPVTSALSPSSPNSTVSRMTDAVSEHSGHGFHSGQMRSDDPMLYHTELPVPQRQLPHAVRNGNVTSFAKVCHEAKNRHLFVFALFHDHSLTSWTTQNNLWGHAAVSVLDEFALCYDVESLGGEGRVLLAGYHVEGPGPIYALLIHPETQQKLQELPLIFTDGVVDVGELINMAICFLSEMPRVQSALPSEDDDDDVVEAKPTPTSGVVHSQPLPKKEVNPPPPSSQQQQQAPGPAPLPPAEPSSQVPEFVSLEPFELAENDQSAFKLRIQFPKSMLTLSLLQSTPAGVLWKYCIRRIYQEATQNNSRELEGKPVLLGGFPPKPIEEPTNSTTTLGSWTAIRSGDKIIARVQ